MDRIARWQSFVDIGAKAGITLIGKQIFQQHCHWVAVVAFKSNASMLLEHGRKERLGKAVKMRQGPAAYIGNLDALHKGGAFDCIPVFGIYAVEGSLAQRSSYPAVQGLTAWWVSKCQRYSIWQQAS